MSDEQRMLAQRRRHEELIKDLKKNIMALSGMISNDHHDEAKEIFGKLGNSVASIDIEFIYMDY